MNNLDDILMHWAEPMAVLYASASHTWCEAIGEVSAGPPPEEALLNARAIIKKAFYHTEIKPIRQRGARFYDSYYVRPNIGFRVYYLPKYGNQFTQYDLDDLKFDPYISSKKTVDFVRYDEIQQLNAEQLGIFREVLRNYNNLNLESNK